MRLKDKINKIIHKLSFTRAELKTILFIIFIIIAGFSFKFVKHLYSGDVPYDFTAADLKFKNASEKYSLLKTTDTILNLTEAERDTLSVQEKNELEKKLSITEDSLILSLKKNSKGKKEAALEGKTININTATKNELISLPGIGDTMAERIISYRNDHNGFKKKEDIMKVKGIGKKKYEKLKKYITVN